MKKIYFTMLAALLTFGACEDETKDEEQISRFQSEKVGADEMEIITDTQTGLIWVNDVRGCFAGIVNPGTQCDEMVFANRDDWRTPTPEELSVLLTAVDAEGIQLNYINTSCVLMSSSERVWVFTENSTSPGTTTTMEPGNAGLRCVTE